MRANSRVLAAARSAALVVFLGLSSAAAIAQTSGALSQKSSDASELVRVAQERGYVRVIAQFRSPVAPSEIKSDASSVASLQASVATAQDAIIATHFGSASSPRAGEGFARGVNRFDITPGFAINVTEQELEALAADARIVRLQHDIPEPPTLLQSVALVGMTNAYTRGATGAGQAIAILDTGVQSNHEFLSGKVVAEACFSSSGGGASGATTLCPNGSPSQIGPGAADPNTPPCVNGSTNLCLHGTHVAGIAAGNNTSLTSGEPTNGVAKGASILAIQVFTRFDDANCGFFAPCVLAYRSDQIQALDYVFANLDLGGGITVASANMSLGGGSSAGACDTDARKPAIDNLRGAGVLTAISSGNSGSTGAVGAPGCISTAITVGSTSKSDAISSFSNISGVVDVLAPGGVGGGGSCALGANNGDILASVAVASGGTGSYDCLAGTSMAAPHAAGAIAAIRTACPAASAGAIETALENTGVPIADTRSGGTQTKPRIRVDLAIQQLACEGVLHVTPATGLTSYGEVGGPFAPDSTSYTVENTGSLTLDWTAGANEAWVTVSPASGSLAPGASTAVTVSIDADANALTTGNYSATVSFTNTNNGEGNTTRAVGLTVDPVGSIPVLALSPASDLVSSGEVGGPFTPNSATYTLTNAGTGTLFWNAGASQNWVTVSPASGTLSAANSTLVTVSIDADANALAANSYSSTVSFTNTRYGNGNTTRAVALTVNPTPNPVLALVPASDLISSGRVGGPFAPDSTVFTLTNTGIGTLNWDAVAEENWVTVDPGSGALPAGDSVPVTVSIDTDANALVRGSYASIVSFTNTNNNNGDTTRNVNLTVRDHEPRNDLIVDLGTAGLFERLNDATWLKIHNNSPIAIAAGDLNGTDKDEVVAVFANGTWVRYDHGPWVQLQQRQLRHVVTGDLDGNGQDDVVGDFAGLGIYAFFNNTRPLVRVSATVPERLATGDLDGNGKDELIVALVNGTWIRYDDGNWLQLQSRQLFRAVTADLDGNGEDDIIGDFAGLGVYAFLNNTRPLVRLRTTVSQGLAAGDLNGNGKDEIVAVFSDGTWVRYDNGIWRRIDTRKLLHPVTVDLDQNGKDEIVGDFVGQGLHARYNNVAPWVRLRPTVSQGVASGGFDADPTPPTSTPRVTGNTIP